MKILNWVEWKEKRENKNFIRWGIAILILLGLMFIFSHSAHAVTQSELLRYEFEEGVGTLILDTSGNSNHGVRNGGTWTTTKKNGAYAFDFGTGNNYITGISSNEIPEHLTMAFWLNSQTTMSGTIFHLTDDNTDLIQLNFDINGVMSFTYTNLSGVNKTKIITNNTGLTTGTYHHWVYSINTLTGGYSVYRDSVLTYTGNTDIIRTNSSFSHIQLGVDTNNLNGLNTYMDSLRIFDFELNTSQIDSLYLTNTIELSVDDMTNMTTVPTTIINYTLPNENQSVAKNFNVEVLNNVPAYCEIYIDNNLFYESGSLRYAYNVEVTTIPEGEHDYFVYCYNVLGDTIYYDLSETTTFNNQNLNTKGLINFYIEGKDFNVNDKSLFITSPCLNKGYDIGGDLQAYDSTNNPDGAYIRELVNGHTSFNLSPDIYEFCLVNGVMSYSTLNKTNEYTVGHIDNSIKLGKFEAYINDTNNQYLQLEVFDIYNKAQPEAYGKTWAAVISGIALFLLGIVLMFAGAVSNNGKVVIGGVLLVLSAFGISFAGFLGVIL